MFIADNPSESHIHVAIDALKAQCEHHRLRCSKPLAIIDMLGLAPILVVEGIINNIKITYPAEVHWAERLLQLGSE